MSLFSNEFKLHWVHKLLLVLGSILILVSIILYTKSAEAESKKNTTKQSAKSERVWKKFTKETRKDSRLGTIIEVTYSYDADAEAKLSVLSAVTMKGYVSKKFNEESKGKAQFTAQFLNAKGKVVYEMPVKIDREVKNTLKQNQTDKESEGLVLDVFDFTVNYPGNDSVTQINLTNSSGVVVSSQAIATEAQAGKVVSGIAPAPVYSVISGSEFLNPAATGTATQSSSTTLNVVYIGDDYTDMTLFRADVDRMAAQLLALEPFKSRASQIMLFVVENTTDLKCVNTDRVIVCDNAAIVQILNSAGIPYDAILAVYNNSTYGGATNNEVAAAYNGPSGPIVMTHEMGHIIGKLADEYVYTTPGPLLVNCSSTATIPASWAAVVAPRDYVKPCNSANWYRSSPNSIMDDLTYPYFNVMSQRGLNTMLDTLAAPYVNTVSPSATITSPAPDTTFTGFQTITTDLTDDQGVARAELWMNGALYQTVYLSPFTFSVPTMKFANGTTSLQVRAYDVVGNVGVSSVVNGVIYNEPDTVKPFVSFKTTASPTSIVNPYGMLAFGATSTDNSGYVEKVELYKDGVLIDTKPSSPLYWNTVNDSNKSYKLHLKAYDYSGNTSTSTTRTIVLTAPPDTTAPITTVTKPTSGTVITGSSQMTVEANASDNVAVTKVILKRDTTTLKTCTGTSVRLCSVSVAKSTFTKGAHTISSTAYDAAGNIGTFTINITKN